MMPEAEMPPQAQAEPAQKPYGGYAADGSAAPTLDDLKTMVLREAAGQAFYDALAATSDNADIRRLLGRSGQEEMSHANRVLEVIARVHGETVTIPPAEQNPHVAIPPGLAITRPLLEMIVSEELKGEVLYEGWASHMTDPEAAALLRRNGFEERKHAERAQDVMKLAGL